MIWGDISDSLDGESWIDIKEMKLTKENDF